MFGLSNTTKTHRKLTIKLIVLRVVVVVTKIVVFVDFQGIFREVFFCVIKIK